MVSKLKRALQAAFEARTDEEKLRIFGGVPMRVGPLPRVIGRDGRQCQRTERILVVLIKFGLSNEFVPIPDIRFASKKDGHLVMLSLFSGGDRR